MTTTTTTQLTLELTVTETVTTDTDRPGPRKAQIRLTTRPVIDTTGHELADVIPLRRAS